MPRSRRSKTRTAQARTGKVYWCEECSEPQSVNNKNRHKRETHGRGPKVYCKGCRTSFTRNSSLTRHLELPSKKQCRFITSSAGLGDKHHDSPHEQVGVSRDMFLSPSSSSFVQGSMTSSPMEGNTSVLPFYGDGTSVSSPDTSDSSCVSSQVEFQTLTAPSVGTKALTWFEFHPLSLLPPPPLPPSTFDSINTHPALTTNAVRLTSVTHLKPVSGFYGDDHSQVLDHQPLETNSDPYLDMTRSLDWNTGQSWLDPSFERYIPGLLLQPGLSFTPVPTSFSNS
jgi:hypothetical protein